jgi:carbonic anhydrase
MKVVLLLLVLLSIVGVKAELDEAVRLSSTHGRAQSLFQENFSYDRSSPEGPERWGELDVACNGNSQSPIDVASTSAVYDSSLRALLTNYKDIPAAEAEAFSTGVGIRVDIPVGSTFTGGALGTGATYNALQFHIHTPSDHTIDGGNFPLELHIVHINANAAAAVPTNPTELTVISLLFREGAASPFLQAVAPAISKIVGIENPIRLNVTVPLASLLPSVRTYYTYQGSLTTPNCRQTVTWHILRNPVTASGLQLQQFREHFGFIASNRPVQPLNSRAVRTNQIPRTPAGTAGNTGNTGTKSSSPLAFASIVALALALATATKYL